MHIFHGQKNCQRVIYTVRFIFFLFFFLSPWRGRKVISGAFPAGALIVNSLCRSLAGSSGFPTPFFSSSLWESSSVEKICLCTRGDQSQITSSCDYHVACYFCGLEYVCLWGLCWAQIFADPAHLQNGLQFYLVYLYIYEQIENAAPFFQPFSAYSWKSSYKLATRRLSGWNVGYSAHDPHWIWFRFLSMCGFPKIGCTLMSCWN